MLLDVMMPGVDGFSVCRSLKSSSRTRDVPVIFLSAATDKDFVLEAFEAGGVDYASETGAGGAVPFTDLFPEPLDDHGQTLGHRFDQFLPWTVNEDGSALETMNHIGRHEFRRRVTRARDQWPLVDFEFEPPDA